MPCNEGATILVNQLAVIFHYNVFSRPLINSTMAGGTTNIIRIELETNIQCCAFLITRSRLKKRPCNGGEMMVVH